VCSDEAAADVDGQTDVDLPASEVSSRVTTDPEVVAGWSAATRSGVVISTYQSLPVISRATSEYGLPGWGIVVFDEAHRCAGPTGGAWRRALSDRTIPAQRRLFLTATPRVSGEDDPSGLGVAPAASAMDDEAMFGPRLYTLGFREAIDRGLLSDYQVLVVGVSAAGVEQLLGDRGDMDADDTATRVSQVALCQAAHDRQLSRVLVFHNRIEASERFANTLEEVRARLPAADRPDGALQTLHIDGMTPHRGRVAALDALASAADHDHRWTVVSNVRCLVEGVDIPAMDTVMFAGPRDSQIDVVQAVGRALRLSPAKQGPATIILPVLIADGESDDAVVHNSPFRTIWQVLRALQDHDNGLQVQTGSTQTRPAFPTGDRSEVALSPQLTVLGDARTVDELTQQFRTRLARRFDTWWSDGLHALEDFTARVGHAQVPRDHVEGLVALGGWVASRRNDRRAGRLGADRVAALDALGMSWSPRSAQWALGVKHLRAFVDREGHANVADDHVADGYRLGAWLTRQRGYQRTSNPRLPPERVDELTRLGVRWDPRSAHCDAALLICQRYRDRTGSFTVPADYVEDGLNLSQWLSQQRGLARTGSLPADRRERLKSIGFNPNAPARQRPDTGWIEWALQQRALNPPVTWRTIGAHAGMSASGAHDAVRRFRLRNR